MMYTSMASSLPIGALEVIKANPSLINTPQAQAEMKKRGIGQARVLEKTLVNDTKSVKENRSDEVKNRIVETTQKKDDQKYASGTTFSLYTNPLEYRSNVETLRSIKSKQNRIEKKSLNRFSQTFFRNRNSLDSALLQVPDYYIVNKKDVVSIWIYGSMNRNFNLKVDNKGNLNVDTLGPIKVAGLEFKEVEKILVSQLSHAFSGAKISVNISSYSTIQVTLTGYVQNPGIYNVASLSTIKDLLIVSGGIKFNGSIRDITIKRDSKY